jgi:hypothetical protein
MGPPVGCVTPVLSHVTTLSAFGVMMLSETQHQVLAIVGHAAGDCLGLGYVSGPIDVVGDDHYDLDGYLELDRQFDLAVEGLLVFLSQFPGYSRSPTASRACCRSRKTRMRRILLPSNS